MSLQISWTEHKKHTPDPSRKRSHHCVKKRRSSRFDERWKRSGAMTGHHGCDEHYKNRTCPGCQGDEETRCGSSPVPAWRPFEWNEEKLANFPFIKRKTEDNSIIYEDKDLKIVYYSRRKRH